LEKKESDRRGFFSKIAKLGIAGGIGALLLGRLGDKTLIPPVHAVDIAIDAVNTGHGTTQLDSNVGHDPAFMVRATRTTGYAHGVVGESKTAVGIVGLQTGTAYGYAGVYGSSLIGNGVHGVAFGTGDCVLGDAGSVNAVPIAAIGASGQMASLQEWRNRAGTPLSVIDKDGRLGVGTSAPVDMIHVVSPSGQDANIRFEGSGNVTGFVLKNTGTGGRDWRIRVNKDTIAPFGGLVLQDDTAVQPRMVIDTSGRVGIGTTGPTETLHVVGKVRATGGLVTGDVEFANGIKTTEEGDGLAFLNARGNRIAVLDSEGNLRIKGDIVKDPTL